VTGPRTREANQARLVRCSAGCGTLVWLKGALPTTADLSYVCDSCIAERQTDEPEAQRPTVVDLMGALEDSLAAAELTLAAEKSGTPQPPDRHGEADGDDVAPRDGVERPF
jgi:hypothetical protein